MSTLMEAVSRRAIVITSLKVSLVVGTVLNLINQGQPFLNGEALSLGQVALNYVVPYCVASYSAAKNELRQASIAPATTKQQAGDE